MNIGRGTARAARLAAVVACLAAVACGGTAVVKPVHHAPKIVAPAAEAEAPPPPPPQVAIKGLTGTLNTDDVHQRMDAQQPAFDECIQQCRRTVRFVDGAIRFEFAVDAEGHVAELVPIESTIGHRQLEQCLTEIVAATEFPPPAGRATARFSWGMSVQPVGTPAEPLEPERVQQLVRKRRIAIAHDCELKRRDRFRITAYVGINGRVVASGAFSKLGRAPDKVDCVLQAVNDLHLPKVTRRSKVSFDL